MSQEAPSVLIVPGLHPRGCEAIQHFAYSSVISAWEADGYNVSVQQFGWNDRVSLADRQAALLEAIDALPNRIYGIGASAGSLALITALRERPDKFHKLVTVAGPLSLTEADFAGFKRNPLVPIPTILREAYHQADDFLNTLDAAGLARIASIHGRHDPRVLTRWSQRPRIVSHELPTSGHGRTIMGALRKYRHKTQALLA